MFKEKKGWYDSYIILHLYMQFLFYRQKPLYVKNHYDFLLIYAFISFYSPLKTEQQGDFKLPSNYRSVNLSVRCAIKTSKGRLSMKSGQKIQKEKDLHKRLCIRTLVSTYMNYPRLNVISKSKCRVRAPFECAI